MERSEGILATATRDDLYGGGMEVFKKLRPDTFNLYMNWLVRTHVPTNGHPDEDRKLVELYILGQLLEDYKIQDAIITSLAEKSNGDASFVPSADVILLAFSQTHSDCALRRLLVDVVARKGTEEYNEALLETLPADFTKALAKELLRKRSASATDIFTEEDLNKMQDDANSAERSSKRQKRS